jgi:hypothetical protein
MIHNIRSIYFTTRPEKDMQISIENILNLKNLLKDFDLVQINDHYAFIYNDLNIIISHSGHIQFSLISTRELSHDIMLLTKLAFKANSIFGIKKYSKKITT